MRAYKKAGSKAPKKLTEQDLFDHAVKLLAARASATEELRAKLRMRAAKPSEVDAVITRLKDIGYLDDERYAESFAAARRENDGFGKFRVLMDLRKHRVAPQLAEQAVEKTFEGTSEAELVDQFIERRMGSIAAGGVEDPRKIATAYRKLRRAGFSSGIVIAALKRYAARPEEIEEPPAAEPEMEEVEMDEVEIDDSETGAAQPGDC